MSWYGCILLLCVALIIWCAIVSRPRKHKPMATPVYDSRSSIALFRRIRGAK